MFLKQEKLLELLAEIDSISQGFMSDEDKQRYIEWLEKPDTVVGEGGRHPAVKILGCSYYYRYSYGWKDLTDDQRHDKLREWNQQHCNPPLPDKEFEGIWKWIVSTRRKSRDAEHKKLRDLEAKAAEERITDAKAVLDANIQAELQGNLYYITKSKPLTFIVSFTRSKMLKTYLKDRFDSMFHTKL